jgi:hypothetical protein
MCLGEIYGNYNCIEMGTQSKIADTSMLITIEYGCVQESSDCKTYPLRNVI